MTHPNLALLGKQRAGKDSIADHLVAEHGYVKLALADPVRDLVRELNPIIDWSGRRFTGVELTHGYEGAKDTFTEFRGTLQRLGVAARKILGEDIWIETLTHRAAQLRPGQPIIVTDVRFPNERDYFADHDFELVHVARPALTHLDAHESENSLDGSDAHFRIINDGTLADLHAQVDDLISRIGVC